ncbi:MAG: hypothetical protein H0X37_21950 [Herpetosiphonaceae bacterium]|nr:hypothetical protein [Herpetosiphonaceae bacterium]
MIGIELPLIVLLLVLLQLFAINTLWQRVGAMLHRAADRPPFTTTVTIQTLGPQPQAVSQLLDRATRLDLTEVDELIEAGGGRVPVLMSRPAAERLAQQLRRVGSVAALTEISTAKAT